MGGYVYIYILIVIQIGRLVKHSQLNTIVAPLHSLLAVAGGEL